jgi:hypothetical protein
LKKITLFGIFLFAFSLIGAGLFGAIFTLLKYPQDLWWNGLFGLLLVLGGLTILFFARRRQYTAFFPVAAIMMMGFIFTFTSHVAPTYLKYTTPNDFCAKVASRVGRDAELLSLFWFEDEFIINELDRKIPNIDDDAELHRYLAGGKQVYIIMEGEVFFKLKKVKPQVQLVIFQKPFLKMNRSIALVTNKVVTQKSDGRGNLTSLAGIGTARNSR